MLPDINCKSIYALNVKYTIIIIKLQVFQAIFKFSRKKFLIAGLSQNATQKISLKKIIKIIIVLTLKNMYIIRLKFKLQ